MEHTTDSTLNRPDGARPLDGKNVPDIDETIIKLRSEPAYQHNDRNAITLVHTDTVRVVLIAVHANAVIREHRVSGTILIRVLDGSVKVKYNEEERIALKGETIMKENQVLPEIVAIEDSALIISILPFSDI